MKATLMRATARSYENEIVSAAIHLVTLFVLLPLASVACSWALTTGGTRHVLVTALFFGMNIAVCVNSVAYHILKPSPLKDRWRRLDHASIYGAISGAATAVSLIFVLDEYPEWSWLAIIVTVGSWSYSIWKMDRRLRGKLDVGSSRLALTKVILAALPVVFVPMMYTRFSSFAWWSFVIGSAFPHFHF